MNQLFSLVTFWEHPTLTLAFLLLILSIASLWIKRSPWVFGPLAILSFLLAYRGEIVKWESLIPLFFLLFPIIALTQPVKGFVRLVFISLTAILSFGLMLHFIPGFKNWKIASDVVLKQDAVPYHLYFNFDKPFIGLFLLGIYHPLIESKKELQRMLVKTIPITIIGIGILIYLSYILDFVKFDLSFSFLIFPWLVSNLFFTTISEEAFFRGLLQREITTAIQNRFPHFAGLLSILIVSIIFALAHFFFIFSFKYAFLVFVASIIYGTIYQVTKNVEGSILCHFLFNLIHFLFFTYPALKPA